MRSVITFYKKHFGIDLSGEQLEMVRSFYKREEYKKKTLLFRQGDYNTPHYLIEKGLLRLYIIDSKGKEINILFAKENQVLGDLATPSETIFYLETTEDSIVYSIEEANLQKIIDSIDTSNSMSPENGLRRSYIHIQRRLVSILSKSAEENYIEFRDRFPDLIQRLPQYHIAAYLGISPEFLSKIIAKTARK